MNETETLFDRILISALFIVFMLALVFAPDLLV
jgi:hypothetical protein